MQLPLNFEDKFASEFGKPKDEWAGRFNESNDAHLQTSMDFGLQQNPDSHAKTQKSAKKLNVPIDLAERNSDEINGIADRNEIFERLKDTEFLKKAFKDPNFASIAHDDVGPLSKFEKTVKALGVGGVQATLGISESIWRTPEALSRVNDALIQGLGINKLSASLKEMGAPSWVYGTKNPVLDILSRGVDVGDVHLQGTSDVADAVGRSTEILGGEFESFRRISEKGQAADIAFTTALKGDLEPLSEVITDPESWAGFLGQAAPSLYAAYKSGGAISFIAWLESMEVANDAADFEKRTGHKIDPVEFTQAAAQVALVNSFLEKLGLNKVFGQAGKGKLSSLITGAVTEGGTEGLQQFNTNVAEYLTFDPGKKLSEGILGSVMGGMGAGGPSGVLSAMGRASGPNSEFAQRLIKSQKAFDDQAKMDTAVEAVMEVKTKKRQPEAVKKFVDDILGSESEVLIPAEDASVFFQSHPEIIENLPDEIAESIQETIVTGGDVSITKSDYLTYLSEFHEELSDSLRNDMDGMNAKEANEWVEQGNEQFEAEAEKILVEQEMESEFQTSAENVQKNIKDQIVKTGRFTEEVAEKYSQLHKAFAETVADLTGKTPEQVYEDFGLKVRGAPILTKDGAVEALMQAGQPKPTDVEIDDFIKKMNEAHKASEAGNKERLDRVLKGLPYNQSQVDAFFQKEEKPRAQIQFDDGALITLLENADLTSFLHESGHFFFEAYRNIPEVADDMQILLDFVEVKSIEVWNEMSTDQRREGHEKVARAFEAYLLEGKSPNIEMQTLFSRFRDWLLNVYQNLTNLNVELTDEVRQVFDRMLATREQIREKEVARAYEPLFESAEEAGMTEKQWKSYQNMDERRHVVSESQLQTRSIKDMKWLSKAKSKALKTLQNEAKAKRKTMRAEVSEEVSRETVYRALRFLKKGELVQPDETVTQADMHKLDQDEFVRLHPNVKLPRGLTQKEGIPLDIAAQMLNFTSGEDLTLSIINAEPQKARIDRLTDERMMETYGDLTDPVSQERAAEEAIHNEAHTRFLHTELTSLTKATGNRNVLARAAKNYAEQAISRKKARDIKPFQYSAAESRAAKNTEKAMIQGDRDSAAEHKRAQVLNNHFFRAANNARTEIDKMLRYFKKFDRKGTRDNLRGEYLQQIDALLERFDLKTKSLKEIDRISLVEFVKSESVRLVAVEMDVDPNIANEGFKKHYKNMTVEELRGLNDTLKQMEHLARREKNMYIERRNMMFEEEKQAILGELQNVHPKAFDAEDQPIPYTKDKKPLVKELSGILTSKFDAEFINIENLLEIMTLGKGEQIFDSLFGRLSEAADNQSILMKEISDFLKPFTKAYSVKERLAFNSTRIKIGEEYFTREKRISIALNYGNVEGRQRLIDGNQYSEAYIQQILNTLEKRDLDFINAFWEMSETFIWPKLKTVEERTKGLPPKKVESISFEISAGKATGGYVPLVYDGDLNTRAYDYHTDDAISDMRGGTVTSAATKQSASKERLATVKNPLNLSLSGMTYKINETIHDVTHREAVTDTYRLMKSKRLGNAIKNISGPDVYNALLERVREVAVKPIVPQGFTERTLWYARRNTLINMMGLSFNTFAINVLGASPAIRQVGAGRFIKALSKLTSPRGRELYDWVMEDPYMRERIRGYDRDLSTEANRFMGKGNIGPTMTTWLIGLGMMDRAVTLPTYVAAFEKGMKKFNNDSKLARQYAGRVIRQTQGSGRTVDIAKISGGTGPAGEFKRIITMYYNFFSAQLGQMVVSGRISSREWSEGKRIKAAQRMTLTTLAVIVIPATLEALARGECGEEPEEIFACVARSSALFAGQLFPIFRDLFPTMWKQFDPEAKAFGVRLSPVEAAMETVAKLPKATVDVATGDFTEGDVRNVIRGVGYLAPGPGFQATRTLEGYIALMEGETDNPMVLLTGPPR